MPHPLHLTAAQKAELSDLKLVLLAASHNAGAALRGHEDAGQALENAVRQARQAVDGLERMQIELAREPSVPSCDQQPAN